MALKSSLLYRPDDAWVGDVIPFFADGVFSTRGYDLTDGGVLSVGGVTTARQARWAS